MLILQCLEFSNGGFYPILHKADAQTVNTAWYNFQDCFQDYPYSLSEMNWKFYLSIFILIVRF